MMMVMSYDVIIKMMMSYDVTSMFHIVSLMRVSVMSSYMMWMMSYDVIIHNDDVI